MQSHKKPQAAFLLSTPLPSSSKRQTQSLSQQSPQPLVCVSRPEASPNVLSAALSLVTGFFIRSPQSKLPPSTAKESQGTESDIRTDADTTPPKDVKPVTRITPTVVSHVPGVMTTAVSTPASRKDTDGLQARLRARDDNDGVKTRLATRRTRAARKARNVRALPPRTQKRRRSSPFPFFSRPSERPVYPSAFERLSGDRIVFFIGQAIERGRASPQNPHLATILPYDLQRALFDDLTGAFDEGSSFTSPSDPPFPAKPKSVENDENEEQSSRSAWGVTLRVASDIFRFVTFQPASKDGTEDSSTSSASVSSNESAAAYTAAAMASETASGFEAVTENNLAAAAYAAAAAIATSTASKLHPKEVEGLKAAVTAARAVANAEDATTFVNTVGLDALIIASNALSGTDRAGALTALANIAIVLPKARVTILAAEKSVIVKTIVDIVYQSTRFHIGQRVGGVGLWYTEALVSGTHLLGSLALSKGKFGKEFRKKMAKDVRLVRRLERLAGGMKNGEAEGAARAARRALGVLGINQWKPRVPGQKGLRILSIDGGGTRAILAFETVRLMA